MHIFRRWHSQPFQGVVKRKKCATLTTLSVLGFFWGFFLASTQRIEKRKYTHLCSFIWMHTDGQKVKTNRKRREEKKGRKAKREWQKAAISCSLVLREHIYFPLISNALVNFLSLFIACTCDLSLAACKKKEKFQNGHFRESITRTVCFRVCNIATCNITWQAYIKKNGYIASSCYCLVDNRFIKQPVWECYFVTGKVFTVGKCLQ